MELEMRSQASAVFTEAMCKYSCSWGAADSNVSKMGYLAALNRRIEELSGTLEARIVL